MAVCSYSMTLTPCGDRQGAFEAFNIHFEYRSHTIYRSYIPVYIGHVQFGMFTVTCIIEHI